MSLSDEQPSQWGLTERFSQEELQDAMDLRDKIQPDPYLRRRDQCPHTELCPNVAMCIEAIAWYLRHRDEIEA